MWTLKERVLKCGAHDCVESPEMDRQTDREPALPNSMEQLQSIRTMKSNRNKQIYMDDCYMISSERDCRVERVAKRSWLVFVMSDSRINKSHNVNK
jgi:hypothetical protein